MPWRGHLGYFCRVCGRHISECGGLSVRYKCRDCATDRCNTNMAELVAHDGPYFDHWRSRCMAAFGIPAVDTQRDGA